MIFEVFDFFNNCFSTNLGNCFTPTSSFYPWFCCSLFNSNFSLLPSNTVSHSISISSANRTRAHVSELSSTSCSIISLPTIIYPIQPISIILITIRTSGAILLCPSSKWIELVRWWNIIIMRVTVSSRTRNRRCWWADNHTKQQQFHYCWKLCKTDFQ